METNKITRNLTDLLYPAAVLIAYRNTEGNRESYFLELRTIDEGGNFCEGRPVSFEFMNELLKGYSESHSTTPYGSLPDNLLFSDCRKGSERYVWYNPPCRRMMFFNESLGIESAEYNIPGVVYDAGGHGMRIYAYLDKKDYPRNAVVCRTILQCHRGKRMSGQCQNRKAEESYIFEADRILGKEILAHGVLPSWRWK